jgi:hypothetical protein
MAKHVSITMISAYIDGEAKDPRSVALHLQGCAECARLQVELSKLSTHLHALPEPVVRSDFARDVTALVADDRARRTRRWTPAVAQMALAATVILAVGLIVALRLGPSEEPPVVAENSVAEESPGVSMEDHILDQLSRPALEETGGAKVVLVAGFAGADANSSAVSTDDMVVVLASTEMLEELDGWSEPEDVDTALASLSQVESQQFRQLLAVYARNGVLGDYEMGGAIGW